jgi:hypothetical protein
MQITARIARFERRRPIILVFLCVVFAALFALDGFINWPNHDDKMVRRMQHSTSVDARYKKMLAHWPGWNHASMAERAHYDHIVHRLNFAGWHTVTDIENQRWIALAITVVAALGGAWWWRVNRKKIVADDSGVTMSNGQRITWNQIRRIDNRNWISQGIVDMECELPGGQTKTIRFDSMIYDDLGPLLNAIAEKCPQAEMINPPDFESQPI